MTVLRTLRTVARKKPVERRLVCPDCGGEIALIDGLYICIGGDLCLFCSTSLQPLVPEVADGA